MPSYTYGTTITVRRPAGVDRYGDQLPAATWTVSNCSVYPSSSSENMMSQRDMVTDMWFLQAPFGVDIRGDDEIIDAVTPDGFHLFPEGETFQVEGKAEHFQSKFTGWKATSRYKLRSVTG